VADAGEDSAVDGTVTTTAKPSRHWRQWEEGDAIVTGSAQSAGLSWPGSLPLAATGALVLISVPDETQGVDRGVGVDQRSLT
jgi:hypothetical protein